MKDLWPSEISAFVDGYVAIHFFALELLVLLCSLLGGIIDGKTNQSKWILIAIAVILLSLIFFFLVIKHIDSYWLSKLNRYNL